MNAGRRVVLVGCGPCYFLYKSTFTFKFNLVVISVFAFILFFLKLKNEISKYHNTKQFRPYFNTTNLVSKNIAAHDVQEGCKIEHHDEKRVTPVKIGSGCEQFRQTNSVFRVVTHRPRPFRCFRPDFPEFRFIIIF